MAVASNADLQNVDNVSLPLKVSLADAVKKAVDNSSELSSIDISIKKLWKVTDENKTFEELSNYTQKQMESIDTYFQLFEKGRKYNDLTYQEEQELLLNKSIFGDIPPPYSKQQLYERYINGTVIPYYSSWVQLLNLKNTYNTSKALLEMSVQDNYYKLLYITDSCEFLENSLSTMEKQYPSMILQYEKGLISELEKYQYEVELNKQKLQVKKAQRKKEIIELLFKQLCGIDRSQKIELTSNNAGLNQEYELYTYKSYKEKAIANRSEVINAKLKLEVLKKELEFYDKYINQKYAFDRLSLEQQIEDAEFSVTKSILSVTDDIQRSYTETSSLQSQMEIQKRNALTKTEDYDIAVKKYSQGQISLIDLWKAKDAASSAEIEYKKAQRDMALSFNRLEFACNLGPAYS